MNRPTWLFALCSCALTLAGCSGDHAFEELRDKEPITYTSGTLKISGLLSKPPGKGPFPLLLINHGGFEPTSSVAWLMDLFIAKEFVTLAADFRGCGKSNGARELAMGEVDDVLNALEYARGLPYVDSRRVGAWGFSSGGSIALLAASRGRDIRAVVSVQGPIEVADCFMSWVEYRDRPNSEVRIGLASVIGGTPDQVPEEWKIRSPLYVADRIKCPVLLIYGDRDDAVPADQGGRMEAALQKSGNISVSLMMVEGANHGLDEKSWPGAINAMTGFFRRELGTDEPTPR